MGVPSFFAWLTNKFGKIIQECHQNEVEDDLNQPNPNGIEYDNLYIDLNGLIHPCFHPTDRQNPKSVGDVLVLLCKYIDYLVNIVRPRKLLYLAIDGVAPRAKMNQQRSRRFKSAKKLDDKLDQKEIKKDKKRILGEAPTDSNCITPGTPFMAAVNKILKKYIKERMNNSDYWNSIVVILNDSSVAGEGEHKIIDFIRRQRDCKNYNSNIHHCIYGLDADLIMLSLSTHERFFSIIRDKIYLNNEKCYICNGIHSPEKCRNVQNVDFLSTITKPFIFVHSHVLRECLKNTFKIEEYDFERCIDDFIFFCFLVGNDFLPNIPSLDIKEGAIDVLISVYQKFLPKNGYLTENGDLIIKNVQKFMSEIGKQEVHLLNKKRLKEEKIHNEQYDQTMRKFDEEIAKMYENYKEQPTKGKSRTIKVKSKKEAKEEDEKRSEEIQLLEQRKKEFEEQEKLKDINLIKFGEKGYKERYYHLKFQLDCCVNSIDLKQIVNKYYEGLNWVFAYYYKGCQSWNWYYPYYYAPFAEDLSNLLDLDFEIKYELGLPFKPFEQLMSVLPPQSKECLPIEFHDLMKPKGSPLSEFYPETFKLDFNGENKEYKAIPLIGFIDEKKLLQYVEPIEKDLIGHEKERNKRFGITFIFIGKSNRLYKTQFHDFIKFGKEKWLEMKKSIKNYEQKDEIIPLSIYKELHINSNYSNHALGGLFIPIRGMDLGRHKSKSYMLGYITPQYKIGHIFKYKYLNGEKIDVPIIAEPSKSVVSSHHPFFKKKKQFNLEFTDYRRRPLEDEDETNLKKKHHY